MHFERMTIEAGGATLGLNFHPRLTVVAGVGRLEREGLIGEMVGALGPGRRGVHLEVASDGGTRYALRRPVEGPDQVIEVATGADVTHRFRTADGRVDLLERAGLTVVEAKRAMRLTADDLTSRSEKEERIARLAQIDQGRLWDLAAKVKEREQQVAAISEHAQADEDTRMLAEVERRHREFERAEERHEQARRVSLLIGANAALVGIIAAIVFHPLAAVPFILLSAGMAVRSALFWRDMVRAYEEEERVLREAGALSYLTFQIHRVNGLLADDQHRRRMMKAAEYHRAALSEWQLLAGDVPVDWALEHRGAIRQAAARLRDTLGVRTQLGAPVAPAEPASSEASHALLHRLNQARSLGAGGESFPLFLDEPFVRVDAETRAELVGLLVKACDHQQVVLLTEDEDIAAWARVEALTGQLSIVEPAAPAGERGERSGRGSGGGSRRATGGGTHHAVA